MADKIYTHEFVDLENGVLAKPGMAWGGNALQSITIARNTPRNPQQAVGYLGVVDFTRSISTSDVTLDCILVEECAKAFPNGGTEPDEHGHNDAMSVNDYGQQSVHIGFEEYVLTSINIGFNAGSPATVSYGYLTASIASSLAMLAQQPQLRKGEEDPFAVVIGDDGSGVDVLAVGGTMAGAAVGQYSYADPETGALLTSNDGGIPAGLQSLSFSASLNRDNILDVRSSVPMQFVTTYPIDISSEMTLYVLPSDATLTRIGHLIVKGAGRSYTAPPTRYPQNAVSHSDEYVRCIDMNRQSEQEGISVGQYRSYSESYTCADLWIPIEPLVI